MKKRQTSITKIILLKGDANHTFKQDNLKQLQYLFWFIFLQYRTR